MTNNDEVPLKEAVQEHIASRSLTDAQHEALEKLQQAHPSPQHEATRPRWWYSVTAVGAVALAILILWIFPLNDVEPHYQIASEVALNHIKHKPLEVVTDDMGEIRAFFAGLDFVPPQSDVLASSGFALEGGRHCSIQGREAAQLWGSASSGTGGEPSSVASVYMAAYDEATFGKLPAAGAGETPLAIDARGVAVSMWVERGVLVVLARTPP